MKQVDQLASLLSPDVIPYAERINMPYLGYHLLRETITTSLLGESEGPILYWMGREIGRHIPLQSANGLVMPFIRLGLGKLELLEEGTNQLRYRLFHSMFSYMTQERMSRSLSLECGIIAGAVSSWRKQDVETRLELEEAGSVVICVSLAE